MMHKRGSFCAGLAVCFPEDKACCGVADGGNDPDQINYRFYNMDYSES